MTQTKEKTVFWNPGEMSIIDDCINGVGRFSGETLEQVRKRHPAAVEVTEDFAWEQVCKIAHNKYKIDDPAGVKEITEEDFFYFLEVLPPMNWRSDKETKSESFMLSEMQFSTITLCIVALRGRFFKMYNHTSAGHAHLVNMVERRLKQ